MMLFGEKYPDVVRMVSIGDFSKELCGGTHLDNTGQVGLFKIIGEESVAAGTRRITALTGRAALEHVRQTQAALSRAAAALRVPPDEVPERVEALAKEVRQLKKQAGRRAEGRRRERRAADRRRGRGRRREGRDCRSARRAQRVAAVDRPASPQGRAGGRAAWPIGRRKSRR